MTEQPISTAPTPEQQTSLAYGELFSQGLERAEGVNFDLMQAVAANYGPRRKVNEVAARTMEVISTAVELSAELELKEEFFDNPSNTIMLAALADAWLETEKDVQAAGVYDPKIADERAVLAEVGLILGGGNSGTVNRLAAHDPALTDRYVRAEQTPVGLARKEALEALNDPELAAKVASVFEQEGEGSFLHEQRQALGVTAASQKPFDIKVLQAAEYSDFIDMGILTRPQWQEYPGPEATEEAYQAFREGNERAKAQYEEDRAYVAPYKEALDAYNQRFAGYNRPLPKASLEFDADGNATMYLRVSEALALVRQFETGKGFSEAVMPQAVLHHLAHARHEYVHSQKPIPMGAHSQLGLVVEERRAELLSGDKHGYLDVKVLFEDLVYATNQRVVEALRVTSRKEDSRAWFLGWAAKNLGLRGTLQLMMAHPESYDSSNDLVRYLPDTKLGVTDADLSPHDAIVRGVLERYGDDRALTLIGSWLEGVGKTEGEQGLQGAIAYAQDRRNASKLGHISRRMEAEARRQLHANR